MTTQPDLFSPAINAADRDHLRTHLYHRGWQTRRQLCQALGWTERQVRDVAESMGADIVRGQAGFRLTEQINRDSQDFSFALQAADAAESQAHKMTAYALALRKRLHALIG